MKIKVAVGISGGVDSAVAAARLQRAGYDVIGVYLHCFPKPFQKTLDCTDKEDFKMAQRVAKTLGIPFTFFDFEKAYQEKVIEYFFQEYEAGRTPNPDAVCNKEIKFGLFLEKAIRELGVDFVATGHYARIRDGALRSPANFDGAEVGIRRPRQPTTHSSALGGLGASPSGSARPASWRASLQGWTAGAENLPAPITGSRENLLCGNTRRARGNYHLLAGVDPTKDQSYFLYNLSQAQLSKILFPVGEYTKVQVRQMAKEFGLPNWDRKDSQGICFLGKISVRKFLEQRIKPEKGEAVDTAGRVIGEHDGVWFYTIGQRHGFRIKPPATSHQPPATLPLYVVDKDVEHNHLIVGWGKECEKERFLVEKVNWINSTPRDGQKLRVRIRHLGELYPCRFKIGDDKVEVVLAEPAWGVAPGQVAVFYKDDEVLGGGIIA